MKENLRFKQLRLNYINNNNKKKKKKKRILTTLVFAYCVSTARVVLKIKVIQGS